MTSYPSNAVNIRPCTARDIGAITKIYRFHVETGTASFETEPPIEAEMQRRFEMLTSSGFPYIVAEINGEIAGYAYAGTYRARFAYNSTVEDSIYIDEQKRGHGIGYQLLDALVHQCTRLGFRQMIAVIGDSSNIGSVNVHRKAGFELVGTFRSIGWKHGKWLDTVMMQLPLGDGDATPRNDNSTG